MQNKNTKIRIAAMFFMAVMLVSAIFISGTLAYNLNSPNEVPVEIQQSLSGALAEAQIKLDEKLVEIIDEYASKPEYYRDARNINESQYKAYITLIKRMEARNHRYAREAHGFADYTDDRAALTPTSLQPVHKTTEYDRQAAYNYAQKYWDEVCSDGYFWDTTSTYITLSPGTDITGMTGYDCAHFVSCCIGNEPKEPGGGLDVPSRVPPTYGEPGAAKLGDWLIDSGNAVEKISIAELEKGDVINYDWNGDGYWNHVALYLGNGKVAAHTSCVWDAGWQLGGAQNYRFIHIVAPAPGVIYVPDEYSTIQAAVDAASAGDTIIVRDGTYTENVKVNKQVTIRSENGSANCVVHAASYGHLFEVTADYVNISGFTETGAIGYGDAGMIYLYYADYCNISNNNCSNNGDGIDLWFSDNNVITNNICSDNGDGIDLWCSNNNVISNNNCSNNWDGFDLWCSENNELTGNTMLENGISIGGGLLSDYTQEIDESNTVNGKPVYYWKDVNGGRVPDGAGQVILVNCSNVIVENQNLNDGSVGILVAYSSYNTLRNNNCSSNNWLGIELDYSNNNVITNNICSGNVDGIVLSDSNNNIITNNICSNDEGGIFLYDSNDNRLTGNTMLGNGISIGGDSLSHYTQEIDESNTVNGKPVYYWKDVNGGRVPDGAGQVILVNCEDVLVENQNLNEGDVGILVAYSSYITVMNNNCSNNWAGIELDYSNDNVITNNNCSNNIYDIELDYSNNNVISNNYAGIKLDYSNNNIISNNWDGIYLRWSNNNVITSNNCSNSNDGIFLIYSNNNSIYLNNFMNNTDNVYSYGSTNNWNSPEKITYTYRGSNYTNYMGNHWDDYTGEDADNDGIGDTSYSINSDEDIYPLMARWEIYFAPSENIFDTGAPANPYPSIMGNHTGTIKPNHTVIATKLYTYPCAGTGGHTEYARIWNSTWNATATWKGYTGDWHNISFDKTVVLLANKTYNYTIRTGSYPQIIHRATLPTENGWINCTKFTDANGRIYTDWIPAIRLE